jgi:biofilm PGA synthesis N-glycosyltransferase PgaC
MITFGIISLLALLAIWFGYPVVVRILAAFRRAPRYLPVVTPPSVSVIVASHDQAPAIASRVLDLLASDYPAELLEVVVALDAANAKASVEALRDLDHRLTVVVGDAPGGKASSLNAGVRAAHHDILVFTDTAQRFDSDAISQLVAELRNPSFGAVSGSLELGGSARSSNLAQRYWRLERWLRYWEGRLHSTVGATGAIYALRRELWEPLPAGLINDDVYTPMRIVQQGWRVGFTQRSKAHDARHFDASGEYKRKVRTLTGVIQVCFWLPGVLNPFRNPIWLQFVFHKLLRLLTPYLCVFVALSAAWTVAATILARPEGARALAVVVFAGLVLLLRPRFRRIAHAQVAWGLALLSSVVVATVNGARGRWDVWQ